MEENPFEQGAISPPTPMPRTVSAVTGPPPLPERPATTNVNNISGLLSTKLVLKPIDDAKIPDTASAYRSPPIANYLPVNEITLKGHSKISSFSGYYAVTGTSNV